MSACSIRPILLLTAMLIGVSVGRVVSPNFTTVSPADQTSSGEVGREGAEAGGERQQFCNFLPVSPGQICCDATVRVNRTSPDHDGCCRNPNTGGTVTFNSDLRYCDPETGVVWDIPEFPPFSGNSRPSNTINFPLSIDYYDAGEDDYDSVEGSPEFHRWCLPRAENELLHPEWRGTHVRCCGDQAYMTSQKICCAGLLYDNSAERMLCCYDRAYEEGDPRNPCLGQCGGSSFNSETELCCQGTVHRSTSHSDVCCGAKKIDRDQEICCGGSVLPKRSRHHGCCARTSPYHRRYMQCLRDGTLRRNVRKQFKATKLCGRLPTWGSQWPLRGLQDRPSSSTQQLLHVEGRVSLVDYQINPSSVNLTLGPHVLVQSDALVSSALVNSTCYRSQRLVLHVHLGREGRRRKCRGRKLRQYLQHIVLHVFFPLSNLSCSDDDGVKVVYMPAKSREHLILRSVAEE